MELRQQIISTLDVNFTHRLAAEAAHNRKLFDALLDLCTDIEKRAAWRAAWVIEKVALRNANSFDEHDVQKIIEMTLNTPFEGVRRSCLTMLVHLPQIKEVDVNLLNQCYVWLLSAYQPVAIQALSLKLIVRFCSIEPQLLPELAVVIIGLDDNNYSKGIKSLLAKTRKLLI